MTKIPKETVRQSQADKFREAAREHETDQSEEAFNTILRTIGPRGVRHASDCAVYNAPAMKPGRCDCGAVSAPSEHGQ